MTDVSRLPWSIAICSIRLAVSSRPDSSLRRTGADTSAGRRAPTRRPSGEASVGDVTLSRSTKIEPTPERFGLEPHHAPKIDDPVSPATGSAVDNILAQTSRANAHRRMAKALFPGLHVEAQGRLSPTRFLAHVLRRLTPPMVGRQVRRIRARDEPTQHRFGCTPIPADTASSADEHTTHCRAGCSISGLQPDGHSGSQSVAIWSPYGSTTVDLLAVAL
jgi:hypothetical protein